jgi:cytosine/adenosine deaminase-related metal-dependent hydrolase
MADADLHLSARWVVAWDGASHRLIEHGEVVVDGGRVRFVGRGWRGTARERVDCGNAVLGPGFVDLDALSDIDSTVLVFDHGPGWRKGRVWSRSYLDQGPREAIDAAGLDLAKRWAWLQLLRHGITTAAPIASIVYRAWSETADEFDRATDIAAEVGLRTYLGPAYCGGRSLVDGDGRFSLHLDEARGDAGLRDAIAFVQRRDGAHGGLVRGLLAPDRIEGCPERLLVASRDAARELGVPLRLHCCQSALELHTVHERVGVGSLEWLERLGVLDVQPLLPHGALLGGLNPTAASVDADLARLAASGATVVHCPLVMARFGLALRSFGALRRRGIRIAMGTDTFPADMLLNLQLGVLMARLVDGDALAATAAELYHAATVGGADALGRADLGRIAPGARADLTAFDLADPRTGPFVDPVQSLVIGGAGLGFRDVWVDGRRVIRDRHPPGHDLDALHAEMNRRFAAFRATCAERAPVAAPADGMFPPAFPRWDGMTPEA